jgi:hypothetical protein
MPCDVIDLPRWLGGPLGTLPVRRLPMHPAMERVGRWAQHPTGRWALLAPFATAYLLFAAVSLAFLAVGTVPMLLAGVAAKGHEKAQVCMKLVILYARVMYMRKRDTT